MLKKLGNTLKGLIQVILNEDIRISNKLLECIKSDKCSKQAADCLFEKIDALLEKLEEMALEKDIRTSDFANDIYKAINDVLREIMRYDSRCNKMYIKHLNIIIEILKYFV